MPLTSTTMHDHSLTNTTDKPAWRRLLPILLAVAAVPVLAILVWQGLSFKGNPDPTVKGTGFVSAIFQIAVLVFREGLESILVLAAITASVGRDHGNRSTPIFLGAGVGFFATLFTWFIVRGILNDISVDISYLALQAITGLVAVVVLLVVMNWFFHKVYWGGWIVVHNRRKKELLESAESGQAPGFVFWGLVVLGLTSVYREGFEVVLFLQSYYLNPTLGGWTVLYGSLIGLALTFVVAVITFVLHRRMPYRKMLILTGIMLGVVLLVMVGEEVYEMQQANWISTTNIPALAPLMPDWTGVWLSLYPNWETVIAQLAAAGLVIGSYFISGKVMAAQNRTEDAADQA